ncbi:hypothetical protein BC939DRAFT_301401 [Gamsiella multidivaricata]|uniref:uncharacterized protein n=1 Tax=Gamsiella multidivaricata TaxID=101098 RepID=UPI00221F245C|nr:uncharacterized protein BC939DRAFT_301401 [Gamsiella multidivaricata]KAI7830179.1 hypothetical protein BC939DRAFT_301401 [Gamsiella multidivaricata]
MARHPIPTLVGNSIHGQTQATLMKLHQQSLEKTINSTVTFVDNDTAAASQQNQDQQRTHNKKKKKYYPWIQRDSQNQRNKIGQEGSRRRQRHDNDKFVHHPFAVLYQVDLPFPGYDRDAPSFHWKHDATIESLISNNPPSSRRSKPVSLADDVPPSPTGPAIGHRLLTRAQRKDIKKVHVPQGIVMQYEGELVSFLDQLTLSEDGEDESEDSQESDSDSSLSDPVLVVAEDGCAEIEGSSWVLVQPHMTDDVQAREQSLTEQEPSEEIAKEVDSSASEQQSEERPQIYLRWDIQDQFLRFVAHALCAFYGLVSFSKTAMDGKRLLYICHPAHLDSIGQLAADPATSTSPSGESEKAAPVRPKLPKRQSTLEHVQELPLHVLDQLWNKVEPVKVSDCLRPDMTFFEYLYPSTRPMFY